MLISRSDRGIVARWWFTIDRPLLSAILLLMAIGVLVSMAASRESRFFQIAGPQAKLYCHLLKPRRAAARRKNHAARNTQGFSEMNSEPEQIFASFPRSGKMGWRRGRLQSPLTSRRSLELISSARIPL